MNKANLKRLAVSMVAAAIGGALALGAGAAQVPIPYKDKSIGPQGLPGDNLPPFMMLDADGKLIPAPAPPPGGYHRRAAGTKESNAEGPSLELSLAGALAAVQECTRNGSLGAAAVVDIAGDARAMLSADGADGSHVFVAQRKALTALEFEMPSIKVRELAEKGDPAILKRVKPNMFVQFGAYPLTSKGKVIGAIGYSGGTDEACVKVGWEHMQQRLPK